MTLSELVHICNGFFTTLSLTLNTELLPWELPLSIIVLSTKTIVQFVMYACGKTVWLQYDEYQFSVERTTSRECIEPILVFHREPYSVRSGNIV